MSISSEITRINNNIASAYSKVEEKGGTLPGTQNSANLATAIDSISGGGGDEYFKNVTLPVQNIDNSWSTILKKIPEDITITIQGNSIQGLFRYYYGEELPYFDTSNVTTFTECFMNCSFIEECPNYNTSKGLLMGGMFNNCINLKTAPNLDFSKAINVQSLFYNCTSLENIPIYNFKNVGQYSCSQVFYNCTSLTNQSLYNILETLNTVTITNQTYLKLKHWGLTQTQATTCTTLSNWQALANKGWTTGY